MLTEYGGVDLFWIGLSLFLLAMSKGGFPVGTIALPLLILVWPEQGAAARSAVGFMLPMLCLMDLVAMAFYGRRVDWHQLRMLVPAMLAGVAVGAVLFVSSETALLAVSDRMLKLLIGLLGILFVLYFAAKRWILKRLEASKPTWLSGSVFGFAAGVAVGGGGRVVADPSNGADALCATYLCCSALHFYHVDREGPWVERCV